MTVRYNAVHVDYDITINWNIEFKIIHTLSFHQCEFWSHSGLLHLVISWSWQVMCGHEIKMAQIANIIDEILLGKRDV